MKSDLACERECIRGEDYRLVKLKIINFNSKLWWLKDAVLMLRVFFHLPYLHFQVDVFKFPLIFVNGSSEKVLIFSSSLCFLGDPVHLE
uniref:Uncharacterized protein n=1 Tax=Helianthus annuus TaxID=4232 RepID=A0A251UDV9_HELAN